MINKQWSFNDTLKNSKQTKTTLVNSIDDFTFCNGWTVEKYVHVYSDIANTTAIKSLSTGLDEQDIKKYIIEPSKLKSNRHALSFANIKENDKGDIVRNGKNFLYPDCVMIDIDYKKELQQKTIFKDLDCNSIKEVNDKLIQIFKNDPHTLYFDISASGEGIKAYMYIISSHYTDTLKTSTTYTEKELIDVYKVLNSHVYEYLSSTYGFKIHDKINIMVNGESTTVDPNYIDNNVNRLNQATYSSNGHEYYFNSTPNVLYINDSSVFNSVTTASINTKQPTTKADTINKNDKYTRSLINHLDYLKDSIKKYKELIEFNEKEQKEQTNIYDSITNKLDHYTAILNDVKVIDSELIKQLNRTVKDRLKPLKKDIKDTNDTIIKQSNILDELIKRNNDISNGLIPYFQHLNLNEGFKLRCAIQHTSTPYREFYFKLYAIHYNGKSSGLFTDINTFNTHIDSLSSNKDYSNSLDNLFREIYTPYPLINKRFESDFFNNVYDKTLIYDSYLSEHAKTIFDIFDQNKKTVLSAPPGGGKTTILKDYIFNQFDKGADKIALVIPKNSINIQQSNKLNSDAITKHEKTIKAYNRNKPQSEQVTLIKNYGNDSYNEYNHVGKVLVISSTPKLKNCYDFDLLIIDEIHNLVKFSKEIISIIPNTKKLILMSATPELYLIGLDDYYYLRCDTTTDKRKVKIHYDYHYNNILKGLLTVDSKNYIYVNSVKKSKEIKEKYKDFKFHLLNAQTKSNKHTQVVINNELLTKKNYISTSYTSDGINWLNGTNDKDVIFDKIIIIDNGFDVFDLIQSVNRFRHLTDIDIHIITVPRKRLYNKHISFEKFNTQNFNKISDKYKKEVEQLNSDSNTNKNHSPNVDLFTMGEGAMSNQKSDYFSADYYIYNERKKEYIYNSDYVKALFYEKGFEGYYSVYKNVYESSLKYYFNIEVMASLPKGKDAKISINKELQSVYIRLYKDIYKSFTHEFVEIPELVYTSDENSLIKWSKMLNNKDIDYKKVLNKENKADLISMTIQNDYIKTYNSLIKSNKDVLINWCMRYKETLDYCIPVDGNNIQSLTQSNKVYKKWINRQKAIISGSLLDGDFDAYTLSIRGYNDLLKDIIMKDSNGFIQPYISVYGKHKYDYFIVDDLVKYFNNNDSDYKLFKHTIEGYQFKNNKDSISKYLQQMSRYFILKTIRINDVKTKVYQILTNN